MGHYPNLEEELELTLNPLDDIETILTSNDWDFERIDDDELTVGLNGNHGKYCLSFTWKEDFGAIQVRVQYDVAVHSSNLSKAANVLMTLNERLWLGHFEIPSHDNTPCFRYTCFLKSMTSSTHEQLENIVETALTQCENYHVTFKLLSQENAANDETLPLALMETQGIS